eukprot:PhM_4_TR2075/c4_g4_i1/m.7010/K11416/SIRT6, SIR2L6; mono-ADP-ribosyltransferase sirtuin 6
MSYEQQEEGSLAEAPRHPHGYTGDATWTPARCVCSSAVTARPKYSTETASEFLDAPSVLRAKVDMLADIITSSVSVVVYYTGAGISTSAGIPDYASRGNGSLVKPADTGNRLLLPPTYTHRALSSIAKTHPSCVLGWLQQNHDGLAQKAGFPYDKLNEIHGSWFDRNNPVVQMDGHLRKDLADTMAGWCKDANTVIAMGTSLCGMTSDCVAEAVAARHVHAGVGGGLIIINLQETPLDASASLRIFARVDDVMRLLVKKLKLRLDMQTYSAYPPPRRRRSTPR